MTIPLVATNWVDGIGMEVDADAMNDIGVALNASTQGRPRISTITSSATPAINTDNCTQFTITALATAITSMSSGLTGTPHDGQKLILRIKDNQSPQNITWGASWRGIGLTLPTKTIPGGTLYIEAVYNSADSIWDVVVVRKQLLPVQVIGANSAAATSVAIPTHQPGDLILIFAFNNANTTQPTAPAASGTVPNWVNVTANNGTAAPGGGSLSYTGNTCAVAVAQFIATANNHTTGTWTNTTDIAAVVLRGEDTVAAVPYGGIAVSSAPSSTANAVSPSVTLSKADGSSALLYFYAHRNMTSWDSAPAGCTRLTQAASVHGICLNKKNDTTTDGSITQTLTGSSAGIMSAAVEIVAAA